VKERVYEYVTDKIVEKPVIKQAPKFSKTRIKLDPKYFNNPFNIGQ
jgi:hypothetical protein